VPITTRDACLFVIPSEVEESVDISAMSRDYDFWVYIVTNLLDSVLYIGMTNDLARDGSVSIAQANYLASLRIIAATN
jgi:hypothetical protein